MECTCHRSWNSHGTWRIPTEALCRKNTYIMQCTSLVWCHDGSLEGLTGLLGPSCRKRYPAGTQQAWYLPRTYHPCACIHYCNEWVFRHIPIKRLTHFRGSSEPSYETMTYPSPWAWWSKDTLATHGKLLILVYCQFALIGIGISSFHTTRSMLEQLLYKPTLVNPLYHPPSQPHVLSITHLGGHEQ